MNDEFEELVLTVYGGANPWDRKVLARNEVLAEVAPNDQGLLEWNICDKGELVYEQSAERSDLWITGITCSAPRRVSAIIGKEIPLGLSGPTFIAKGDNLTIMFPRKVIDIMNPEAL